MWSKVRITTIDAMIPRDVTLRLYLPRKYTACVVVLMTGLTGGHRNQVVQFGLKAIFGDHKDLHAGNTAMMARKHFVRYKMVDSAQRKN